MSRGQRGIRNGALGLQIRLLGELLVQNEVILVDQHLVAGDLAAGLGLVQNVHEGIPHDGLVGQVDGHLRLLDDRRTIIADLVDVHDLRSNLILLGGILQSRIVIGLVQLIVGQGGALDVQVRVHPDANGLADLVVEVRALLLQVGGVGLPVEVIAGGAAVLFLWHQADLEVGLRINGEFMSKGTKEDLLLELTILPDSRGLPMSHLSV